jgi:hypothetical protein
MQNALALAYRDSLIASSSISRSETGELELGLGLKCLCSMKNSAKLIIAKGSQVLLVQRTKDELWTFSRRQATAL